MDEETPWEILKRMFAAAADPIMQQCIGEVRAIAEYDIPQVRCEPFLSFHRFITDPQPTYVTNWRADEKLVHKWYHPHVNGILGDLRGALAAAHYHQANLATLEDAITRVFSAIDFEARMGNSTIGLGGTRKLDFEYQAFVLGCRRALDYLAGALACYFKIESNSFRSLPKQIKGARQTHVADSIVQAHARHVDRLAFILADGRKSTRNRIAHYEFVPAGVINLTKYGFMLLGGGEELDWPRVGESAKPLQEALSERLNCLHDCVEDMISSFVKAARDFEASI